MVCQFFKLLYILANLFVVDAIYVRAIYSPEFSDRLWGLGEYGIRKPIIDLTSVCLVGVIFFYINNF